jgi:hypothetical protein
MTGRTNIREKRSNEIGGTGQNMMKEKKLFSPQKSFSPSSMIGYALVISILTIRQEGNSTIHAVCM